MKNKYQQGGEKEFLQNWYSKRKIPDEYLQGAFELDKPNILKRLNNFKGYNYVNSLNGGNSQGGDIKGQFDQKTNRVLIKKGIDNNNDVKLHELNHYATYDPQGDYITSEHTNIVNKEIIFLSAEVNFKNNQP